jgi:integrase
LSYAYGWRKSEVIRLRVHQIDMKARTIRLEVGTTKNNQGREVTMTKVVQALLVECVHDKSPADYVLTRDGERVKDLRAAWRNLWVQVGLGHWQCRTVDLRISSTSA